MQMSGTPTATIDLLDAPIPEGFAEWQKTPDEVRWPHYEQGFRTDPVLWSRHKPPTWSESLTWSEFRYSEIKDNAALDQIVDSDLPGIYIFYVRPDRPFVKFPQFALYVGIANERESKRPLRERLKDYLPARIAKKRKRRNIDRMLRLYYGVLWVTFSLTDKPSKELAALEENLHGFIYPPYGRRDFPVDIKNQQKAFGKI